MNKLQATAKIIDMVDASINKHLNNEAKQEARDEYIEKQIEENAERILAGETLEDNGFEYDLEDVLGNISYNDERNEKYKNILMELASPNQAKVSLKTIVDLRELLMSAAKDSVSGFDYDEEE